MVSIASTPYASQHDNTDEKTIHHAFFSDKGFTRNGGNGLGPREQLKPLRSFFGSRSRGIAFVYALLIIDNLVFLSLPAWTGAALDGLLRGLYTPLVIFALVWAIEASISAFRQSYDTRLFTRLSSEYASSVAAHHSAEGKSISVVAARSNLSREVISFFAQELPTMCRSGVAAFGALAVLFAYDPLAGLICSVVLVPAIIVNLRFFREAHRINQKLNNRVEREITALGTGSSRIVRRHYLALSRRRVLLSDKEALTSYVMRMSALFAVVLVILRIAQSSASAGDMYAMIAYAMMFFVGLGDVPLFVGGVGRLRDIVSRLQSVEEGRKT